MQFFLYENKQNNADGKSRKYFSGLGNISLNIAKSTTYSLLKDEFW